MTEHYVGVENVIKRMLAVAEECGTDTIHIDRIITELENIPSSPAICIYPRWIPVTERLPDVTSTKSGYEQIYVIATDGKYVRPMIYERACPRGKTVYRWKWIWDRIYDGNPITHWMPLPEPPKGGSTHD